MMIISLKVNYKCQSGRKRDRVGFYVIYGMFDYAN